MVKLDHLNFYILICTCCPIPVTLAQHTSSPHHLATMYFTKIILALILAAGVSAAAIAPRQDQAACDQGRSGVVNSLKEINTSAAQIQDAAVKQAVQSGLQQSAGGVQQIGQAIKAGQAPPAGGRDQVQAGFEAMNAAIIGANQ